MNSEQLQSEINRAKRNAPLLSLLEQQEEIEDDNFIYSLQRYPEKRRVQTINFYESAVLVPTLEELEDLMRYLQISEDEITESIIHEREHYEAGVKNGFARSRFGIVFWRTNDDGFGLTAFTQFLYNRKMHSLNALQRVIQAPDSDMGPRDIRQAEQLQQLLQYPR